MQFLSLVVSLVENYYKGSQSVLGANTLYWYYKGYPY